MTKCGVNRHLWQGDWIDDPEAGRRLGELGTRARKLGAGQRWNPLLVAAACDRLTGLLAEPGTEVRGRLTDRLRAQNTPGREIDRVFTGLLRALDGKTLRHKAELAGERLDGNSAPSGLLAHIAAGNTPAAGAISAVEGLLGGALNVVKTIRHDSLFTAELLAALAALEPAGRIAERVIVLRFSAARTDWLTRMCEPADAITVCGDAEALADYRDLFRGPRRLANWTATVSAGQLGSEQAVFHNGQFRPRPVLLSTVD